MAQTKKALLSSYFWSHSCVEYFERKSMLRQSDILKSNAKCQKQFYVFHSLLSCAMFGLLQWQQFKVNEEEQKGEAGGKLEHF